MTTVNQLKLAANAGDPDSVLALRIDVVKAACEWFEAITVGDSEKLDDAELALERAARKYKAAVKRRSLLAHHYFDAT